MGFEILPVLSLADSELPKIDGYDGARWQPFSVAEMTGQSEGIGYYL